MKRRETLKVAGSSLLLASIPGTLAGKDTSSEEIHEQTFIIPELVHEATRRAVTGRKELKFIEFVTPPTEDMGVVKGYIKVTASDGNNFLDEKEGLLISDELRQRIFRFLGQEGFIKELHSSERLSSEGSWSVSIPLTKMQDYTWLYWHAASKA